MDTSTYGDDALVIHLIPEQVTSDGRDGISMSFVTAQPEALTAVRFAAHAQMYQAVSAQAAIHETFVNTLSTSSGSYAVTEAANAAATG
jgi:hypothetical protein